jgi:hypothetical protein
VSVCVQPSFAGLADAVTYIHVGYGSKPGGGGGMSGGSQELSAETVALMVSIRIEAIAIDNSFFCNFIFFFLLFWLKEL